MYNFNYLLPTEFRHTCPLAMGYNTAAVDRIYIDAASTPC